MVEKNMDARAAGFLKKHWLKVIIGVVLLVAVVWGVGSAVSNQYNEHFIDQQNAKLAQHSIIK